MKAGRYAIEAAPAGTRPDLTGLSCRWNPIEARNGEIVSIIVLPGRPATISIPAGGLRHRGAGRRAGRGGHPVPVTGPDFGFPPKGLDYEARAAAPAGQRFRVKRRILFEVALAWLFYRLGRPAGGFDRRSTRATSPAIRTSRKFDDGLKMTVDIDADHLARIESRLAEAAKAGHCRYGLHRQNSALMTCIVPSRSRAITCTSSTGLRRLRDGGQQPQGKLFELTGSN